MYKDALHDEVSVWPLLKNIYRCAPSLAGTVFLFSSHCAEMHTHDEDKPNTVTDPLKPALDQGHKPSRGAEIDKELQEDDERRLKEKGIHT